MQNSLVSLLAGACGLVLTTGAASAFTELEPAPSVPGIAVTDTPAELREDAQTHVEDRLPALRMIDPTASATDDGGTVLSIPGIGRIGTLPKFNFGLELLYGTPDATRMEFESKPAGTTDPTADDVIIRGTIKHRF